MKGSSFLGPDHGIAASTMATRCARILPRSLSRQDKEIRQTTGVLTQGQVAQGASERTLLPQRLRSYGCAQPLQTCKVQGLAGPPHAQCRQGGRLHQRRGGHGGRLSCVHVITATGRLTEGQRPRRRARHFGESSRTSACRKRLLLKARLKQKDEKRDGGASKLLARVCRSGCRYASSNHWCVFRIETVYPC